MKTKHILLFTAAICTLIAVDSCKKEKKPTPENPGSGTDANAALKQSVKENYANIAFAVYEDAYNAAVDLRNEINAFVASPSAAGLEDVKQAWKDAREPYGQSEVFRFSDGPIDDFDGPEGFINAWPMDEAFVDYVSGNPTAGIINNTSAYPTIDATLLLSLNESGSETNIATGYHAIEFLLWGQDQSALTAGTRSYLDFVAGGGTASNEARRCTYLVTCADLLVSMLEQIKNEWDPAVSGNYRSAFVALNNKTALQKMFNQMAALSHNELAGERMFVAYDSQNQEDEHSCFSDNTHRDIILNAKGIKNIYTGTYIRTNLSVVTGDGLDDLMAILDATKNTEMLTLLNDSEAAVGGLFVPFDQAIVLPTERPEVLDAVNKLQAEGNKLVELAAVLGITITL